MLEIHKWHNLKETNRIHITTQPTVIIIKKKKKLPKSIWIFFFWKSQKIIINPNFFGIIQIRLKKGEILHYNFIYLQFFKINEFVIFLVPNIGYLS